MSQRITFALPGIGRSKAPSVPAAPLALLPPARQSQFHGQHKSHERPRQGPEHVAVSVEAPSLPKGRAGACMFCMLCFWTISTVTLAVVATLSGASAWRAAVVGAQLSTRGISTDPLEKHWCTLVLFVHEGRTTGQQLSVSLCLALDGVLGEEDVRVQEQRHKTFTVTVLHCTDDLSEALRSDAVQRLWAYKLAAMRPASFVVVDSRRDDEGGVEPGEVSGSARAGAPDPSASKAGEPLSFGRHPVPTPTITAANNPWNNPSLAKRRGHTERGGRDTTVDAQSPVSR